MSLTAMGAQDFDKVVSTNDFVFIDFWASWCAPCRALSTILERVTSQYPDCYFASVDIEKEPALAEEFAIRSVPFVMILKNQTIVYAEAGAMSEGQLKELLDRARELEVG